jgi:hypothetical protein
VGSDRQRLAARDDSVWRAPELHGDLLDGNLGGVQPAQQLIFA